MELEAVVWLALLFVALGWPVVGRVRTRSGRLAGAAGLAVAGAGLVVEAGPEVEEVVLRSEAAPRVVRRGGYVGAAACRACHPGPHASWASSHHARMTRPAEPGAVDGDFGAGPVTDGQGRAWLLERSGDRFLAGPVGEPLRAVVVVTGSHHMQVYWYDQGPGRPLAQLPVVWHLELRRWLPRNAAFLRPPGLPAPDEAGRWNHTCLRCHTTDPRPGSVEEPPAVADLGIACEACHGPGAAHVARNRDPAERYAHHLAGAGVSDIVDPRELDHRRSTEVCGQCHSVNTDLGPGAWVEFLAEGFDYRPGDVLEETRLVVRAEEAERPLVRRILERSPDFLEGRFWSDGMIRVVGRELNGLERSPCFQRGALSCLSCHQLHHGPDDPRPVAEWRDDQLRPLGDRDEACLQCHAGLADDLAAHTRHRPGSPGSRCLECHMPHTTYGLHKAVRSHEVDSPDARVTLATGRPNACNQCHLDRSLGWVAARLEAWYGRPRPELTDAERDVSATARWLLEGDAGQRALAAWTAGWGPAVDASAGAAWLPPYLAHLLDDPYVSVRVIAARSLGRLPGYGDLEVDPLGTAAERRRARARILERWRGRAGPEADAGLDRAAVLLGDDGALDEAAFRALADQRDDRPVFLIE